MPQNKPTAVTVIAILQLVFGGLGLAVSTWQLAGGASAAAAANPPRASAGGVRVTPQDVDQYLERKVPRYRFLVQVQAGASAMLCLLMLGSGVGLLRMQMWGRDLALFYAVLSLLVTILSAVWAFTTIVPAMTAFSKELAAPGGKEAAAIAKGVEIGSTAGAVCGTLPGIYPLIVLLIMLRPSVEAALRGEAGPPPGDDVVQPLPEDFPALDAPTRTGQINTTVVQPLPEDFPARADDSRALTEDLPARPPPAGWD